MAKQLNRHIGITFEIVIFRRNNNINNSTEPKAVNKQTSVTVNKENINLSFTI